MVLAMVLAMELALITSVNRAAAAGHEILLVLASSS